MSDKSQPGVWITGASSGIGKAAAIEFTKTGAKVFVSARRELELEKINSELSAEKLKVEIYPCNVSSYPNVVQTVKKILDTHQIDCLVNNAGVTSFKTAEQTSIQEIDDIININLLGAIYSIKAVLPHMIERGGGTIINILSVVTQKIFTNSSAYTASKMGLLGFTNSLREEVRKYKIKVINILPGATSTDMWSSEIREKTRGRMMKSEEIAKIITWSYLQKDNLVSEEILIRPIEGDLS
ncbi:MAG: SDR family oxidoreductase [Ignavibacteriaceae bacterium]